MSSVLRRTAAFTAHEKPVTGDIKMSFVGYDHLGWIKCDGRPLSTTEYNLLFQVLGYTFGGAGGSFNLPDADGRVLGSVGDPNIPTGTNHPPGESIGTETETLTIAEMPSHNHGTQTATAQPVGKKELTSDSATGITTNSTSTVGLMTTTGNNTAAGGLDSTAGEPDLFRGPVQLALTDPEHHHTLAPVGGDQPHNNIQPTLFIGNTFIYSGIPTYPGFPPNPASAWPFTTGLNPPLI